MTRKKNRQMVGFYLKQIRQGRPYCTGRRSQDETTRSGGVQFLGMSPGMGPWVEAPGVQLGMRSFYMLGRKRGMGPH